MSNAIVITKKSCHRTGQVGRYLACLCLCLLVLPASPLVFGQGATATITGIVMDQTQAVVPGATVILIDEASKDSRRTLSNGEGYFTFSAVQAKTYTLRVELTGFQAWERVGIEVHPGDKINIDNISLVTGAQTETVTVTADAGQIIPVDSGEKSNLITSKQIQNLAIVGRDATELLKILPGLVPITGIENRASFTGEVTGINGNGAGGKQSAIGNYSANGGRNDSIDIISDGTHVSDPGCNCASPVSPNVEFIQEFKVQAAAFSAESSKGPVVISSISKSGGSEFHGTGYYYGRRHELNSNDWLANKSGIPRPKSDYSFPGFNIGGPVLIPGTSFNKNKDKLFFFFGAEWIRQGIDTGTKRAIVPTEAMLRGDFTDTSYITALGRGGVNGIPNANGFVNGMITDRNLIDPSALSMMRLYPAPNRDPRTNDGFNWVTNEVVQQNMNLQRLRVDYSLSDNTKLYASYNRQRELQPFNFGLWWNPSDVPTPSRVIAPNASDALSTNLTHIFSPTLTNEFTFGYTYIDFPNQFEDPTKVSRKAIGYTNPGLFKSGLDQIPSVLDWYSGIATNFNPGGFDPVLYATKHLVSFGDNLTKVYRTHTIKTGFYYEHVINKQPNSGDSNGRLIPASWAAGNTGNNYANLLIGNLAEYGEQTKNLVNDIAYNIVEGFVQDSWKVKPNLTLDLGLRFGYIGPWYGRNGAAFAIFDPSRYSNNPADLTKYTGLFHANNDPNVRFSGTDKPGWVFGPRLGMAYSVFRNTVLRGGYGLYNFHDAQQAGALVYPPSTLFTNLFNVTLRDVANLQPERQISSLTVLRKDDTKLPRTHNWNFTISQRLPSQMILETSYVGSYSQNLLNGGFGNLNAVPEGATLGQTNQDFNAYRPFVNYQAITQREHVLSQNYNSLQVLLARQTGRLTYSAAYTFGKNLGYRGDAQGPVVSQFKIRERNYGVLAYDRTHVFNLAYSWLVPDVVKGNAFGKALINGWQISGITIFQSGINLGANTTNFSLSGTGAGGFSLGQANITGTDSVQIMPLLTCHPGENLAKGQYINGNCFAAPGPGRNGVFQFPYVRGPMFQNHDLSLFKNFQIGPNENHKLQLRFSGYNFLNHPLDTFVNNDPRLQLSFNNGVLTRSGQPDRDFGFTNTKFGRRIVQFAIKFMF